MKKTRISKVRTFHLTAWTLRKFTFTLIWKKFRESNVFLLKCWLIWRNNLTVRVNCSNFHTVHLTILKNKNVSKEICSYWKNNSWNRLFSQLLLWRYFCQIKIERETQSVILQISSRFFGKISVKSTFFLKMNTVHWFDEKILKWISDMLFLWKLVFSFWPKNGKNFLANFPYSLN